MAFYNCTSLTSIAINEISYNTKGVDGYLFIVESSKTFNDTLIHKGFTFVRLEDGNIIKTEGYVAEREYLAAHGETSHKALEDLNFKIFVKDHESQPINNETLVTENLYRAITGACRQGVEMWKEDNNFTLKEIRVKDLLPMLEKSNAYGVERFKELIEE